MEICAICKEKREGCFEVIIKKSNSKDYKIFICRKCERDFSLFENEPSLPSSLHIRSAVCIEEEKKLIGRWPICPFCDSAFNLRRLLNHYTNEDEYWWLCNCSEEKLEDLFKKQDDLINAE